LLPWRSAGEPDMVVYSLRSSFFSIPKLVQSRSSSQRTPSSSISIPPSAAACHQIQSQHAGLRFTRAKRSVPSDISFQPYSINPLWLAIVCGQASTIQLNLGYQSAATFTSECSDASFNTSPIEQSVEIST
jgi:hypothetical protein